MTPRTSSSSTSDLSNKKQVRFENKVHVIEIGSNDNEPEDKEYQCYLALGETDNDAYPVLMRAVLDRSIDQSSKRKTEPLRVSPRLLSLPYSRPQVPRPPSKDLSTSEDPVRMLLGILPLSYPIRSGRCIDIINAALDCVDAKEISEISD
jgi:hypothetical protein